MRGCQHCGPECFAKDFLRMCEEQQAQPCNRFRYPGHYDRDGVSTRDVSTVINMWSCLTVVGLRVCLSE
jgi:hypothetical protein